MKILSKIIGFASAVKNAVTGAICKAKTKAGQIVTAVSVSVMTSAMTIMPSFAATSVDPIFSSSDLEPLLEGAKANIAVIIPIGIGLLAITFGIRFALRMLKSVTKH